jgi:DNA polymerase III subunit delta'
MSRLGLLREIVGNRESIDLLIRGRFPQTSLFTGPEGVGKKTIALLVAALKACAAPADNEPCGACGSCVKAASGNHPDIRLIWEEEKASIGIDKMRDFRHEVQYRPFESRARFFVVDHAELMTPEAANAVLKTLEEPPETAHIVLVTAFPDRIIPTVRSRCQVLRFSPLGRGEVLEYLRRRTKLDAPESRAAFSGGSLGRAISIDIAATLSMRDRVLDLLTNWAEKPRFTTVYEHCEEGGLSGSLRKRETAVQCLELLQALLHDVHFLQVGTPERVVSVDRMERLKSLVQPLDPRRLRMLLSRIVESKRDLERNVNPQMSFETLWLETSGRYGDRIY